MGTFRTARLALALAAAMLAAPAARAQGAGGGAGGDAAWDAVVAAAKKEGTVVVYSAAPGAQPVDDANKLFEARYGIKVEMLEGRASEIRERIRVEQSAGRVMGDVQYNGSTTTDLMNAEGAFQPYGPLPDAKNVVPPYVADGTRLTANALSYGILVNDRLVKPGEAPKSWHDLLDPKWKGKILADDMRALGGGSVLFFVLTDKYGADFQRALAAQDMSLVRDIRNAERRVTRGEYPLLVPEVLSYYDQIRSLPVRFVAPEEGCPYIRFDLTLLKGAPHPNAARLLMDFYVGHAAQAAFAKGGYNTAVPVPPAEGTPPNPCTKLMGTTAADRQDAMLKLAQDIYKQ